MHQQIANTIDSELVLQMLARVNDFKQDQEG